MLAVTNNIKSALHCFFKSQENRASVQCCIRSNELHRQPIHTFLRLKMDFRATQSSSVLQGQQQQQQSAQPQPTQRNAFPSKLFKLLEKAEQLGKTDMVSWTPDGLSFKVRMPDFISFYGSSYCSLDNWLFSHFDCRFPSPGP